jgi:hypothetical protein
MVRFLSKGNPIKNSTMVRAETGDWVESWSIKRKINPFLVVLFPLGKRVDREEENKLTRTVAFSSSDSASESLSLLCALGYEQERA